MDLRHFEKQCMYLEGTGSIVFDYANKVAYACESPRTSLAALKEVCDSLGYGLCSFEATDDNGMAIYHTNVMMWIGTSVAAVCADYIRDPKQKVTSPMGVLRKHLIKLELTGSSFAPAAS